MIYDLRVLPATFDLLGFIVAAWAHVQERFSQISLVIVTPDDNWKDREFDFTNVCLTEEIRERVFRLLLPAAQLFPFISSVSVLSSDLAKRALNEASVEVAFPQAYSVDQPAMFSYYKGHMLLAAAKYTDVRHLSIPRKALSLAQSLLRQYGLTERNFVALALRHNAVSRDRSRDTPLAWANSAIETLSRRTKTVVLPDLGQPITSHATAEHIIVLREPQFDIQLRAAIYALAKMVIVGPTGPSSLAYLNRDCAYCYVGLTTGSYFDAAWHRNQGWVENENMFSPGNPTQRWFWEYPNPKEIDRLLATIF